MPVGPHGFSGQPLYGEAIVIDTLQFSGGVPISKTPIAGGTHTFVMADLKVALQRPLSGDSESASIYRFDWNQRYDNETEKNKLDQLAARGQAVYLVPYSTETETFVLAAGVNTLTLRRPEALTGHATFNKTTYPHVADVDGTSKTVVATTPADGTEIQVVGSTVTTHSSVSAGEVLTLRYYAAYRVSVGVGPETLATHNRVSRPVVMIEAAL